MKRLKIFTLALAAALSVAALEAQSGWTYEGCWSPYPNCAGGKHVYRDASGNFWQCNSCSQSPSTSSCYQSGNLYNIGYWCS